MVARVGSDSAVAHTHAHTAIAMSSTREACPSLPWSARHVASAWHLHLPCRPGPCAVNYWETNSLVLHATAASPLGPFRMRDVALPSSHTNPQVMRTPGGEWLLYSQAPTCTSNQYGPGPCRACHKGRCGPQPCAAHTAKFAPLPLGPLTLTRRERPKM